MSGSSADEGAEEGDATVGRGWPLHTQHTPASDSDGPVTIAAIARLELLGGWDVVADGALRAGGALCRPVSAPARASQQRRGVSDPALESHPRPRGRPAGSLTPHVSLSDVWLGHVSEMLVRSGRADVCISGRNCIENRPRSAVRQSSECRCRRLDLDHACRPVPSWFSS
jgi:hypothetical protein